MESLSRRRLLRGVGVSMALPWLESKRVWGGEPAEKMVLLSQPQASLRYDSRCSFLEMVFIASSGGLGVKRVDGTRQRA